MWLRCASSHTEVVGGERGGTIVTVEGIDVGGIDVSATGGVVSAAVG
jgi:hypothetical protein